MILTGGKRCLRGYGLVSVAKDGLVFADAGHEVPLQPDQPAFLVKSKADALLATLLAAGLQAVKIIPALWVKSIADQRSAHDEADLLCRHAGA